MSVTADRENVDVDQVVDHTCILPERPRNGSANLNQIAAIAWPCFSSSNNLRFMANPCGAE